MPTATTYDYDALLTEAGDLTEKYHTVKKVNEKYFGVNDTIKVKNTDKKAYGKVELVEQAELFASLHNLSNPVECEHTFTMEKLVENLGRVNYGEELGESKGITDGVMLDYQYQYDWIMYTIPVNDLTNLNFEEVKHQKNTLFL